MNNCPCRFGQVSPAPAYWGQGWAPQVIGVGLIAVFALWLAGAYARGR